MKNVLAEILAYKKECVTQQKHVLPLEKLKQAISAASETRAFVSAIKTKLSQNKPAVIAEIKKASPSKGIIRENFNPAEIAVDYEQHQACCLSVLTDEKYFQGHPSYINLVKAAATLPILRKDFIIDPYQIYESRALGADCILLIVAALDTHQLSEFIALAQDLALDVLIEIHDAEELDIALQYDIPLLGINNRSLKSFVTDIANTLQLIDKIPKNKIIVSESGIRTPADIQTLQLHGVNSFLIGETFMRAASPGEELERLFF